MSWREEQRQGRTPPQVRRAAAARSSGRLSGSSFLVMQKTFVEHLLCVNSVQSTEDVLGNREAKSRAYWQVTETDEK